MLKRKPKMSTWGGNCKISWHKEGKQQEALLPHLILFGLKKKEASQSEGSPTEDETFRRPRRGRRQSTTEFKVDIPEFEGKLDPDDFLEWMQTVERIFEYKDIPDQQKVTIVALKLRKYASLWWTNLLTKRVRQGKGKIRTWEKMKAKLKARFSPLNYIQAQL